MEDPWPAGVPLSLWTYNQLRAEELVQVPMMGIRFAPGFLYTFAFGCIFIAFFAWKRFSVQSDVKSVSRALSELSPSDMGGSGALIRAYFIYAGAILLLYVSFTFFGRLILQSSQMVPVVGIQVDLNKLQFDSMQWPLMLAFAFAGLAEMLPPIKITEGWLRNRAYRAVGIPVRLEQTMRNLIVTLDRACLPDQPDPGPLAQKLAIYRDRWTETVANHAWATESGTQRRSRQDEAVSLLAQLELLVYWAKAARGSWPGHEVSQSVRQQERNYVDDAVALMDDIHKRMLETPQEGGDAGSIARKARFGEYLGETIRKAEALRFDLVGILAIFLERDLDIPTEAVATRPDPRSPATPAQPERIEPALNQLLALTERPDTAGTGPEAGMFLALIAVFLIYAAAAWRGLQEPIGQFIETSNIYGVFVTALVETLRIAALTWLPLLAAFSLRQYLWDNGDWAKATKTQRRSGYAMQIFGCLCLGVTVSILALLGVAALRAFFVAPNAAYFFNLYVGNVAPFVIYYPTQAIILLVLIPVSIMSADLRKSPATRMWYGVLCALGVAFLSIQHLNYWNASLARDCPGLVVISSLDCARRFDLVGHVVLAVLAFLAAGVLGELPERTRMAKPRWAQPQTAASAILLLLLLLPSPAGAQMVSQPAPSQKRMVYVGFRADTPPFSSAVYGAENKQARSYKGYLADMCFDIFAGDANYEIVPVPITADNRFRLLRKGSSPSSPTSLDMLCDAVTMRFSDLERALPSIFSPVVFASGVSFLERTGNNLHTEIGYIGNSTARDIARKACEIDYFKALLPSERKALYQRCRMLWSAAVTNHLIRRRNTEPQFILSAAEDKPTAIKQSLVDLKEAADRLNQIVGESGITRLFPETQKLMDIIVAKQPAPPAPALPALTCDENNPTDDCKAVLNILEDPFCAGKLPQQSNLPVEDRPWLDYHFCPQQSHDDLVEWFCTAPPGHRRIYMGDRELILGKLAVWTRANGPCNIERPQGSEYLSYEPYAFPISMSDAELIQFVQRRIYEIFSHRVEMMSRFQASFGGHKMSPALAYLFLLNAVENEENLGPRPPSPADKPEAISATQSGR